MPVGDKIERYHPGIRVLLLPERPAKVGLYWESDLVGKVSRPPAARTGSDGR